jgi:hypothetical protein
MGILEHASVNHAARKLQRIYLDEAKRCCDRVHLQGMKMSRSELERVHRRAFAVAMEATFHGREVVGVEDLEAAFARELVGWLGPGVIGSVD